MAVALRILLSCLCRYVVLGFLVSSVVYSTIFLFGSENLQKNAAGLIQKGASSLSSGYGLGNRSPFDIENVRYSAQQMTVQATRRGKEPNTHAIYEDFYLSKAFGNAMQPSKVIPYYFKAEGVFDKEEITITTLITENRFEVFKKLVRNYRGPISVTLWIRDDDSRDQHFAALHALYESSPLLRQYVDVHVVVDRFDFQLNMWRNVARLFARTDYFLLLDVDFHICTDLKRHLKENEMARKFLREGAALVLPAFEFTDERDGEDSATFPKEKRVVEKLVQGKKLVPFHSVKFAPGHEASNYTKWYATDDVYQVMSFNWKYEPYVVLRREGTPWCDERFVGYGANKAACLYEIYISGIDYYVLPQDFLIHQSHAYPESKRSGGVNAPFFGRKLNGELYSAFRDELCLRYAKSMYMANELYTHKAENLMSQCKQLKGFEDALKEFPRMWKSEPPPLL
ncbi:hypothetical protein BGZ93_002167 [Podila epicladia]|nr:hypothetical protein BGZ93_002167 [Podila epicladia]